jgi:ubiquitin-protein ligase E3 C
VELKRFLVAAAFFMRAFFAETTVRESLARLEMILGVIQVNRDRLRLVMGNRIILADRIGAVWVDACKHTGSRESIEARELRHRGVHLALKIALYLAEWISEDGIALVGSLIENELHADAGKLQFKLGEDKLLLNELIRQVASVRCSDTLSEWLSLPEVFTVVDVSAFEEHLKRMLCTSKDDLNFLQTLDVRRRAWTLGNIVVALGNNVTASIDIVAGINKLLYGMNMSILHVDDDGDDDMEATGNATLYVGRDPSDKNLVEALSRLYSRNFSTNVFRLLQGQEVSMRNVDVLASLYVGLIWLWRQRKKDIMLYLSVAVDASPVHIFWNSFKSSIAFAQSLDHIPSGRELLSVPELQLTWSKLVLTLELYSYWLIVADDTEFRENTTQGFSLEALNELSRFLKNLCFSLIWNWSKLVDEMQHFEESMKIEKLFFKLKDICILVTRQIYIRDSRRPIFPEDFWLMTSHIDMVNFIPVVVEEQERLESERSRSDASDNEEMDGWLGRSRRATSSKAADILMAPRIELLRQVPFFMPFDVRVRIFQEFIDRDEQRNLAQSSVHDRNPFDFMFGVTPKLKATIRRESLVEDAYEAFHDAGASFKHPLGIQFVANGMEEAGIDGGGLTKELLTSVCAEGFLSDAGVFSTTNDHLLYPNPIYGVSRAISNLSQEEQAYGLRHMKFLGQIIGKCLYSGILVDVEFAPFFLQKWAGRVKNSFDDLYSLDPEIYSSLVKVRRYPGDVESDLNLDFTITQDVGHGEQKEVELKPNGSNIPVTNSNRLEYIHAVANYKLNVILAAQTNAFLSGMSSLISLNWLSMFNAHETQMLISGGKATIDVEDLAKNTVYHGFESAASTISLFWSVIESLSEDDKKQFIKFVTSVPRAPLLGFSQLNPKFAIRNAGSDCDRLPTASTCVNMLKLPAYKDAKQLREKLLYAIHSGAGFDLS